MTEHGCNNMIQAHINVVVSGGSTVPYVTSYLTSLPHTLLNYSHSTFHTVNSNFKKGICDTCIFFLPLHLELLVLFCKSIN